MMDAEADLIRKDQAVDSFSGVNFWTCNLAIWQTAFIYLYPCTNDFYFEDAGFLIAMFDYHQNEQQRCGLWRRDQDLVCNQLILRRSKHHPYEPWDKSSFIGAIPSINGVISVVTQLPGGMILQVALNQHHDDGDMVGYSPDFFGGMNINRYEFDVNRRGFYGFWSIATS